jgi:hypothetical protein
MAAIAMREWIKKKKLQLALTVLFTSFSAAIAAYRTVSNDPEDNRGFRCQILLGANNRPLSESQEQLYNPDRNKTGNIFEYIMEAKLCPENKIQEIVDLRIHPAASIFGSMLPSFLLSPAIYWMVGWFLKRHGAKISKTSTKPTNRQIIGDFGELIETSAANASCIYDVSALPHPKEEILHAMIDELRKSKSRNEREFLKVGARLLCQYQYGVGPSPIELIPSSIFSQRAFTAGDLRNEAAAIAKLSERVKPKYDAFNTVVDADVQRVQAMIAAAERF